MRGTGDDVKWYDTRHGITPADAGNSPFAQVAVFDEGDHPRGCGEQGGIEL